MGTWIRFVAALCLALLPGVLIGRAQPNGTAKTVSISGRVIDVTGGPVKNAAVKLKVAGSTETATSTSAGDHGEFKFSVVAHRSYELQCYAPGFKQEMKTVSVDKDADWGDIVLVVAVRNGLTVAPFDEAMPPVEPHWSETPETLPTSTALAKDTAIVFSALAFLM